MNVRRMIVAAALICTAVGCASTQKGAASSSAAMTSGAREEEYQFNGQRLKVQLDGTGIPTGAKAFDKNDKEIPTFMVPAREVTVCVPKSVGAAQGAGQQCEPFLYLPEKTFFKIGTGTICSMWYMGKLIYYQC